MLKVSSSVFFVLIGFDLYHRLLAGSKQVGSSQSVSQLGWYTRTKDTKNQFDKYFSVFRLVTQSVSRQQRKQQRRRRRRRQQQQRRRRRKRFRRSRTKRWTAQSFFFLFPIFSFKTFRGFRTYYLRPCVLLGGALHLCNVTCVIVSTPLRLSVTKLDHF